MNEATFDNGVVQLYQGDARRVMGELPAESVHCGVTSPPYWGLRDYGLKPLVWGGDDHEHEWGEPVTVSEAHFDKGTSTLSGSNANQMAASTFSSQGVFCPCGAWRGSLGLEPTIDLYVQHIVEMFREMWRVLRPDGTLWCNLGDSYASGDRGTYRSGVSDNKGHQVQDDMPRPATPAGLKPKDLCMMPARVALALQADGWWLRSDIVWSKPNPMPESAADRPTRAHEYLFLLTKAATYYYDADAIREPHRDSAGPVERFGNTGKYGGYKGIQGDDSLIRNDFLQRREYNPAGRNKRSVWEIPTEPYPEAHFATFPQKLVEPCILAGTSERGVCPECGAPWERVVEATGGTIGQSWHNHEDDAGRGHRGGDDGHNRAADLYGSYERSTTGWHPICACGREGTVPATVLDPFAGSGTVAYVAQRLGRRAIGIDLSADYLALAEKRMRGQTLPMGLAP